MVLHRQSDDPPRLDQCRGRAPAQPGGPEGVTRLSLFPLNEVTNGRGMVMSADRIHVGKLPALAQQIERKNLFFSTHAKPLLKPICIKKCRSANDGTTCSKTYHRNPNRASDGFLLRKRSACHDLAKRVKPLTWSHQNFCGDESQGGISIEE